jgi:DNA helicase II / ATP-dependent DNA helicase PcrA
MKNYELRASLMDKLTLSPTDEQRHILNLLSSTRANLLINALAGTGKTSTLELIQNAAPPPVLCIAFNRRIADEMAGRFRSTTTVRTFNGLGHRIWASACANKLSLNPRKCADLLRQTIDSLPKSTKGEAYDIFWETLAAVGLAKSLGYVPERYFPNAKRLIDKASLSTRFDEAPSDLLLNLLDAVLVASTKAAYAGSIDYNDQVYMPALFGGTYPRFPLVLIDEAQDLSPVNHEMLAHLSRSRLIAVGDAQQAIYSFRGAETNGMQKLKERFGMVEADLTVSFRCPSNIVKAVHWHVPGMRWVKEGGRAARLRNPTIASFVDGSAIICRNNAPLFAVALKLLSGGRSVTVSGSDVGPRIIGILRKLGPESLPQLEVLNAIEEWRAEKLSRQSTTASDIADCMGVFAQFGDTLAQAIAYAEHLFKQSGTIQLLTGHKSKGLEWLVVYHLDPFLLREDEQDLNLRYVIQTRAMETYFEIESREIKWSNP